MQLNTKISYLLFLFSLVFFGKAYSQSELNEDSLHLIRKIEGHISPKSIVSSGKGLFFAQNMMYRHTITVYDQSFNLVKTIRDKVNLKDYGYKNHPNEYKGSPVECAFSHNGDYAWVSNYNMSGGDSTEFIHPGCDGCYSSSKYDSSYVYKINTKTFEIENAVLVGAVPKFLAVSPDNKYLLVSNWSSGDLSIVDLTKEKEIKRIKIGAFPRGIAIDSKSKYAYVAVMGKEKLARISLEDFTRDYIEDVGDGPRHLCIDRSDSWLYISLNGEGKLAKLNLNTNEVSKHKVGHLPRSMTLSKDDKYLYVVNYGDDQVAKVETSTMTVVEKEETADKPIGVTVDSITGNIWVSCYSGKIMVYCDSAFCGAKIFTEESLNEKDTLVAEEINNESVIKRREVEEREEESKREIVTTGIQEQKTNAIETAPVIKDSVSEERVNQKMDGIKKAKDNVDKKEGIAKSDVNTVNSYLIVVGSFSKPSNASGFLKDMRKDYVNAFIYKNTSNDLSYVCIDSFSEKSLAISQSKLLKSKGLTNWVFTKKE